MAPRKRVAAEVAGSKAKAAKKNVVEPTPTPRDAPAAAEGASAGRSLVIEAWYVGATKLEKLLKEALPGVVVSINPDKPRKGCFEVREGEDVKHVSLLDMPRPFTKLKELDLEALAADIASKA
ncbi:Seleno protein H [Haematococcus lacustris]